MHVLILYDHVGDTARPDEADALAQSRAVQDALQSLGHEWMTLGLTLDLDAARRALERLQPELVFNLVESLGGYGRLIHVPPQLLDALRIPYTGASAEAVMMTSNKLLAKHMMKAAGIATPGWLARDDGGTELDGRSSSLEGERRRPTPPSQFSGPYIIKSVWEHASIGLDDNSIIQARDENELRRAIHSRANHLGGEAFAEQYIDGREFNLAMLATAGGGDPEFLPPCEIVFEDFGSTKPRIVNYHAKWDDTSFEYAHTPRRYRFSPQDEELIQRMKTMAMECWRLFDLRGYARVDFRVDAEGQPWVLEVNANPCLSPDAGFAAALDEAGVPFVSAIERIVQDVDQRSAISGQRSAVSDQRLLLTSDFRSGGEEVSKSFLQLRRHVSASDVAAVREIAQSTEFFSPEEIDVAVELIEERLRTGESCDYRFVFADDTDHKPIGFACYGPIACTLCSYDLYWIAIDDAHRGRGIGKLLMRECERLIAQEGGDRVYVETSSRPVYEPTRQFYLRCGYTIDAEQLDFYGPGDAKVTLVKSLH